MKYLSSEHFARINRKPNCLYVGGSYIYLSSFINLSHFQDTILKANYPSSSKIQVFVVISLCFTTTIDTINKLIKLTNKKLTLTTLMARKIVMLVCMSKNGKSRINIALTFKLTSDLNFSSVSFRTNFIPHFWTFHNCFYLEWVLGLLIPEETTFSIKLNADVT